MTTTLVMSLTSILCNSLILQYDNKTVFGGGLNSVSAGFL